MTCRLDALLIAVAIALGGNAYAPAGETLRLSQNIPGDSKPIILYADEIITWTEGSQRVILLKGRVEVEQGVVHSSMAEAVAWIDQERTRRTGILHFDLYAEGDVHIENGPDIRTGNKATLDLNSRGELRLKAQQNKILQQVRQDDPLYRRAIAERFSPDQRPSPSAVQRTSAQEPAESREGTGGAALIPAQFPSAPAENPPPSSPLPLAGPGAAPAIQAPSPPVQPLPPPVMQPVPPVVPVLPNPMRGPGSAPGPPGPAAQVPLRQLRIVPRTSAPNQKETQQLANGEQALFITGGAILTVRDAAGINVIDIEADQLLVWTRGNFQQSLGNINSREGVTTRQAEFYLSGNVEIRSQSGQETRTLRADEVYYDVGRNVAVARKADLEFKQPGLPDPIHFRADELLQLSLTQYKGYRAEIFSSRLPSDPGLKIYVAEGTLEEKRIPKKSFWGKEIVDSRTGQPETEEQRLFHGDSIFVELENVPIFYFPFLQGDANDPLGPLQNVAFKQDSIFGTQFFTTFNVYDLLGIDPTPGTRWHLNVDYLSRRGPALGSDFDYGGKDLFDLPGKYNGLIKAYGIYDTGSDILGGNRGDEQHHPPWRGRFLWRHNQELPEDFTLQFQLSALSDKNFLEQYYKDEFDRDINQETFVYLKQQRENWAWTVLTEPRIRNWVTETEWLPRADGYLIGQSLFDVLTYNVHASAGYGKLEPTHLPPPPFEVTDLADGTGRFDLNQELSYPFTLGPVRLVPYGRLDLTYYTKDLTGTDEGRIYEAAGLRGSMPLTRLYPSVQSDLLNLDGINHKIVVSANFYAAHSDVPYTRLPQLDRINDDATDQALRDIKPLEPVFNPTHGLLLATSPLYDPQLYAIRRLVEDKVDTLDSVEVLQGDIRQRLQTKRGYPGMEHIVDWMTLDLSGSYFPDAKRDNFGDSFAFLQYDWVWNIGDRTAIVSSGWVDPIQDGARVFTIGTYLNRPDRTNFYLGYREIDPLNSQAVTGAVTYVFSPKYAFTASTTYDFGTNQSLSNSFVVTRMGSDLQVSLGVNYNAILNNVGFTFEIFPNLVPESRRVGGPTAFGSSLLGK